MIKVFDTQTKTYRDILDNQEECNGLVCFSRDSIPIIEKYYLICGYYCIDTYRYQILQIDIQNDIVIIPEIVLLGLLPTFIQEMEEYNISNLQKVTLSNSFIYIWFDYENKTIDEVNPFALVCKQIMANSVLLNRFIINSTSVFYPVTVSELYSFAQRLNGLFPYDYISKDYVIEFKYVIDALIKGYHLNFNEFDIRKYAFNISQLTYEKMEEVVCQIME